MSSLPFAVEVRPDDVCRRLLSVCAAAAFVAGLLLIHKLEIDPRWRAVLALVWIADIVRGVVGQWRGRRRLAGLVFRSDGALLGIGPDGQRTGVRLLSGSMLSESLVWLRIAWPDGQRHGELLLAMRSDPACWRRFQLLWRQRGGRFGADRMAC